MIEQKIADFENNLRLHMSDATTAELDGMNNALCAMSDLLLSANGEFIKDGVSVPWYIIRIQHSVVSLYGEGADIMLERVKAMWPGVEGGEQ